MKIVKVETVKIQKRFVYDIPDMDLIHLGPDYLVKMHLQEENQQTIEWLEENIEDYDLEEYDESKPRVVNTEWFEEDDEI